MSQKQYTEEQEMVRLIVKIAVGVVVFVFALVAGCNSYEVVPSGHRGVIVHAGKVEDQVLGEGLTFKLPFYTTIQFMRVRIQQALTETTAASKDMQKVHAKLSLNYHIAPDRVKEVFQNIGSPELIEDILINRAVSEVLKAATATFSAEEILVKRIELKHQIDRALEERLAQFGLVVDAVNLADFNFEPDFNKAVEDKQIAEQKTKKAVYDAQRATQEALAAIETAKGQAESQRLLKQSITKDLIEKLAIEKWDGHLPQTMLGSGTLPFINAAAGGK